MNNKLLEYGFKLENNIYTYKQNLDNNLLLIVSYDNNKINSKVIDIDTNEEYYLLDTALSGEYIDKIRKTKDLIIKDIEDTCFDKKRMLDSVIEYIKDMYNDDPLYLWEDDDRDAVFRHPSGKWYGLIMTITSDKLGLNGNKEIDIINIKCLPDTIDKVVDNKSFFRGYHMNKKYWLTIILDGSVPLEVIKKYIAISYDLTKK